MNGTDFKPEFKKAFQMTAVVCAVIVGSLIIYAAVAEIIRAQFREFRGFIEFQNITILRYALYAAAVAAVIMLRALQRPLTYLKPSEGAKEYILKLSRAGIITAVLAEVPGILGLVLFLMAGLHRDFYILLFISFVLEFMYFPRKNVWEERLRSFANTATQ